MAELILLYTSLIPLLKAMKLLRGRAVGLDLLFVLTTVTGSFID